MEFQDVVFLGREFMTTTLILVAPVVAVSLIVGLTISVGQTITSIQEQTLAFAPRIVAVVVLLMFMMNWYLRTLQVYTEGVFAQMVELVNK